jgi:non-ribosomal peptide synthetase component F
MNSLFGDTLSEQLRELARRERALLATVMLAVYVAVLYRCCNQRDFIVPFFVAGRQSEHKSVVGYFSHILYLRMQLTGGETFRELMSYVGNEFFRALSHQDFGRMATQEPRLLEGTFFQWITWHPDDALSLPLPETQGSRELTVERVAVVDFAENLTAIPPGMVDVEVTFFDTAKGIYASGVYRADLFTADTMERFMGNLRSAAERFVSNLHAPLATVF